MRKHFDLLPSVAALTLLARVASACTAIGIGRHASADGSVMVAHTDDSAGMGDPRLVRVAARDWPANATRNVYLSIADYPRLLAPERAPEYEASSSAHADLPWAKPLGSIPQVRRLPWPAAERHSRTRALAQGGARSHARIRARPCAQVAHTYAYWDVDYGLGNEHALVMAETTCSGRLRAVSDLCARVGAAETTGTCACAPVQLPVVSARLHHIPLLASGRGALPVRSCRAAPSDARTCACATVPLGVR